MLDAFVGAVLLTDQPDFSGPPGKVNAARAQVEGRLKAASKPPYHAPKNAIGNHLAPSMSHPQAPPLGAGALQAVHNRSL